MSSSPAAGHSDPRSLSVTRTPAPSKRPRHSSAPPAPVVRPLSSVPPPPARRPSPAASAASETRRSLPDLPSLLRRAAAARVFGRPPALLLGAALIIAAACFGLRDNLGGDGPFGLSDDVGAFVLDLGVPPPVLDGVFAFVNAAAAVVIFGLYLLVAVCALEGRPWARVLGAAAALPAAAAACAAHSGAQLFAVLVAGLGVAMIFTEQVSLWLEDRRERSRADADAARAFLDQAAEHYEQSEDNRDPDGHDALGASGLLGSVTEPAAEATARGDDAPPAPAQADQPTRDAAGGSPGERGLWLRLGLPGRLASLLKRARLSRRRPLVQPLPGGSAGQVTSGVPGAPFEARSGAARTAAPGLLDGAGSAGPDAAGERAGVHAGVGGADTPDSGAVRIGTARRRGVNGLLARRRRR